MIIDHYAPRLGNTLRVGRFSLISPFGAPQMHMVLHARQRRQPWNSDVVLIYPSLREHPKASTRSRDSYRSASGF